MGLPHGDTETGLTIHRLAPEFDTGPILAQARIPITDDDDIRRSGPSSGPVLRDSSQQALERVARGDPGDPQDESQATEAGLFEDAWRIIDWSQPARTIHNQVRSWIGLRDIPAGGTRRDRRRDVADYQDPPGAGRSREAGASATRHGRASGRRTPGRAMW